MAILLIAACEGPQRTPIFTPMREAVEIVEANRRKMIHGYKAVGTAQGRFRDADGTTRHFDLGLKLQLFAPHHMRLVLQNALGGDELEVGSNGRKWWILTRRPQEHYYEGWVADDFDVSIGGTVPLKPDQLIECMGVSPLDIRNASQRIDGDFQQILFTAPAADGRNVIEKEYWLDRYEPRLIRRILFRDAEGRVLLSSQIDDHQPVSDSGLKLPRRLVFTWPADDARMTITLRNWKIQKSLSTEHRAFVSPRDRGARFQHEHITTD